MYNYHIYIFFFPGNYNHYVTQQEKTLKIVVLPAQEAVRLSQILDKKKNKKKH